MAKNNEVNITLKAKDQASSKLKNVEKNAGGLGSKLGKLGGPLKAIGVGAGIAGAAIGAVGIKMFNMADSLETTIGKSKVVFGEYFDDIDKFGKENAKAMGLSRGEFLKTAAGMQDLLIPMGFTREAATGMTQDTMQLAGALSEWSAGQYTATEAGEILTKAMLGETEQLKSMGISISTGSDEFKNLQASIMQTTGATEQQAKALAIQQLIMEKSTDAQAAYAEGADSLTRKKAEMGATMKNLFETVSTALLPAFHEIVKVLQPIIEKVATSIGLWFQNKENVEKLTAVFKTIISVFGFLFEAIGKAIWFLTKMGEMLGFIAFKVVEFFGVMKDKFTRLKELVVGIWTSISTGTINAWTGIKDGVVGIVTSLYDSVVGKFTAMFDKVKGIYDKIKGWLGKIFGAEDEANNAASNVQNIANNTGTSTGAGTTLSGARATGGSVIGGNSYLVGENGPEVFTPGASGNVSNSSNQSINITFNGNLGNESDRRNMIDEIKMALSRDLQYSSYGIN